MRLFELEEMMVLTVERDSQLRHGRCESWAFLVGWSRATMRVEGRVGYDFLVLFIFTENVTFRLS
jgi:hypothetical protein